MAGLERVEVKLLRWLDGTCITKYLLVCKPAGDKHPVGGQKGRWNDVVVGDPNKSEL